MIRVLVAVCLVIAGASLVASPSAAIVWPSSDLTAYNSSEVLTVTPSWTMDGSYYVYQYSLKNKTAHTYIESFELTFAPTLDFSKFFVVSGPTDWFGRVRGQFHQIDWTIDMGDPIGPNQTGVFTIKSTYGPSAAPVVVAACHDGLGWSGDTYGPVPEPSSVAAMVCGLVGLVGLVRKRR